jgi:hypothetical protein
MVSNRRLSPEQTLVLMLMPGVFSSPARVLLLALCCVPALPAAADEPPGEPFFYNWSRLSSGLAAGDGLSYRQPDPAALADSLPLNGKASWSLTPSLELGTDVELRFEYLPWVDVDNMSLDGFQLQWRSRF